MEVKRAPSGVIWQLQIDPLVPNSLNQLSFSSDIDGKIIFQGLLVSTFNSKVHPEDSKEPNFGYLLKVLRDNWLNHNKHSVLRFSLWVSAK